jgi:uncharacterized protein
LTLLTFSTAIESSDTGRRIIAGQIVPFGAVGHTNVGQVIFERGSIQIPKPSQIKLLAQHNSNDPIGRATNFQETDAGINGTFKVSASTKGTDYLLLASEQLIDGLSVGVEVLASREMRDGTMIVSSAILKEVSLVESPAFTEARVTKVAASEGEAEQTPTQPTNESEAQVENTTEAVTTEVTPEAAAPAPAVEASRPTIKAAQPYGSAYTTPRHGINSMGRYVEHKIKAALGDDTSREWVAASEDPVAVQAAADSIGTTNPAFNPIQYMREFISNTNFGRPAIDAVSKGTLPSVGMQFNIPKLDVAPTVAETDESGTPSNTGMTSEYLVATVKKYSGQQTITLELLERSDPTFFDELNIQLQRAYLKATDQALIDALVAGGTLGTKNYATTSAGVIDFISTESPLAYTNTSYFAKNFIAGAGMWSLLMGAVDSTGRPIYSANNPWNAAGATDPGSIKGNVLGLDLYVDRLLPSTLVDDSAIIVAPETATWYESPTSYFSVNIVNNMQVQTAIYGYGSAVVKQGAGIRLFNVA